MWKQLDVDRWAEGRRGTLSSVRQTVEDIVRNVSDNGDAALFELTERYDKVKLDRLRVSREQIENAYSLVSDTVLNALITAKDNIERFHRMQRPADMWTAQVAPGLTLGVKSTPLDRVGAYIPGGRASYPSTVLMCVVPAKVAGVTDVVVCTPPPVAPLTLVAADLAGADEVYQVGGAQAVAAMAVGTRTMAPVQKIVGPGNVYVTEAKMLLRGVAEIDFPAGPSEIAVLADSTAQPEFIAADILAQAEHDPNAACVLITTDDSLPRKVWNEVERMAAKAERAEIINKSLVNAGYVIAKDMESAVAIVDRIAPEHLSIQVADPLAALNAVRNAGSIFVGRYAPVACGDYASGTNHVLPTAGYAGTFSALDVGHFMKRSQVQIIDRDGLDGLADTVVTLAKAEGLHAHAESVRVRLR